VGCPPKQEAGIDIRRGSPARQPSDRHGTPLGYDLRPANENEREGVFALAGAHPGSLLFADAGHRGREHHESLQLVGVELIVPARHRLGERPPAEISKARIRLVIESVFATLKRQMRLEEHLAKTLPGLAQCIVQRLLALTIGMFLNTLLGRPPRALAAYDGR
jgi:Transposase DDE domain